MDSLSKNVYQIRKSIYIEGKNGISISIEFGKQSIAFS